MPTAPLYQTAAQAAGEPAPRPIDGILAALRAGIDREANERRLFDLYYRLVRHFFRRRGCSGDEAEDLSQETFLRLFDRLESFRGEARFETWMLRIAENVLREEVRRASTAKRSARETSIEALRDQAPPEMPRGSEGPDVARSGEVESTAEPLRRLLDGEKDRALLAALDELPPQMGQCLRLRFIQELSYREIAAVLRLSIDTVKVQLHRGRKRLRHLLSDHFDHRHGED